ncbi:hypothetical protein [Nocardia bovistercoris]|uniref:Alpha/beta hydrolase n=1 Tax=Nocardia bovistercoris TaxID=2785916 RepID=A0A931MYX1_9NOCA|nr:hypothetical protein [Nocardia bovistercoris]MBH0775505.1 hypothetical protein [Nocardia bovistercoris]
MSARGAEDFDDADGLGPWWALARDPMFELRLLATEQSDPDVEPPPMVRRSGQVLLAAARRLSVEDPPVAVTEAGLGAVFADAVDAVLDDEVTCPVIEERDAAELVGPLARAIVAAALAESVVREAPVDLDGASLDELVSAVSAALYDGRARGEFGAAAKKLAFNLAMRSGGSRYVDRKRRTWSTDAAPLAGDVLVYLTRGGGIKDFIAARVREIAGPVILLAHSLGGIAALELLVSQELPNVRQLVTVGSQGPLLYELDALPTLRFGLRLPNSVPEWSNIYDPRDLLAYRGAGVFPGRVRDYEIDNRTPFPWSHSAYFFRKNERFYRLLGEVLA